MEWNPMVDVDESEISIKFEMESFPLFNSNLNSKSAALVSLHIRALYKAEAKLYEENDVIKLLIVQVVGNT